MCQGDGSLDTQQDSFQARVRQKIMRRFILHHILTRRMATALR